jgi:hypothetical protein
MLQSYKNFLTYASKSQEKSHFSSFYKQISISMFIPFFFFLAPNDRTILYLSTRAHARFIVNISQPNDQYLDF